jgi:hypothetical protein
VRPAPALVVALLLLVGSARGEAQALPAPPATSSATSPSLSVTLVTFGQAEEVFERFGHDALWFHDSATGLDIAYHWGLFDFNEPHFVARFVSGDTRYAMGGQDALGLIEGERRTGRTVTLQRLALTTSQAESLLDFVRWNALDENRYYRYDYFRDNCATRLRDALDRALDGQLRRRFEPVSTPLTYRSESLRLTDAARPAQLGIDLALGRPADRPLTVWESFFIPMRLRDALRGMTVAHGDSVVALVAAERVLPAVPGAPVLHELDHPPHLVVRYLLSGLVLALAIVGLRVMSVTRRGATWGLALAGAGWWLACGVLGVLIGLAWAFTRHVFWARNEHLLLLTPLCLALVVLTPMALLSGRALVAARQTAIAAAALGVLAAVLALLPGGQASGPIVALLLPTHLALAWALAVPLRRRPTLAR